MERLAKTATQKVVKSMAGIVTTFRLIPGNRYGKRAKSDTKVVKAYKAKTLINQANNPTVKRFSGKNRIFSKGTNNQFISIKAIAPKAKLLKPPVKVKPVINLEVRVKDTAFIRKERSRVFIFWPILPYHN